MDLLSASNVQHLLIVLGYWNGPVTGDLRDDTFRDVLKKFQAGRGLTVDGWYGAKSDAVCRDLLVKLQAAPSEMKQMRRWRITDYYVALEGERPGVKVPILSDTGATLANVSAGDFASAALEGTIRLKDGRLLNVTGRRVKAAHAEYSAVYDIAVANRWVPDKPGYAGLVLDSSGKQVTAVNAFSVVPPAMQGKGYGVLRGIPLTPFRTLAADIGTQSYRNVEPLYRGRGGVAPPGSEVFIVEFVGKSCPDGKGGTFTHDGWFVVNDTGGGIFGAHFDMFTGGAALAKYVSHPGICHVWYRGKDANGQPYTSEVRVPWTYSYGI